MVIVILALLAAPAQGGPTPEEAARRIEARYAAARTLKAVFLERYTEGKTAVRVESGTVYFARGGRMRWEYESPEEKLFVSDGKTVWFYVPADRTVTRSKVSETPDWHTPLAFLAGKVKFSRVCGRVELADGRVEAAGNVLLRCVPKNARAGFSLALIESDASGRLVRVEIREAGGIETAFRFGAWEENVAVADSMFKFLAPAGVAIVEGIVTPGANR
jgi:outer membrane lipoprotein carrier protein